MLPTLHLISFVSTSKPYNYLIAAWTHVFTSATVLWLPVRALLVYRHLKQLQLSNKMSASVIKAGVVDVDISVLSHLKEELAWAVGKQLWVISTTMLFKKQ